ncbi:MAG: YeeE/YedE thiosulfate transporter family protein [Rudaea sp.]|uniref:YeeE/YedE family protein n=1 Tax=Rudaea sp. TaxID=2136325 RepID=UPI0039E2DCE5
METWIIALLGGVLIGLAAVLLMAALGRIAGISGIAGGLATGAAAGDRAWRVAFVVGLVLAPLLMFALRGDNGIGAADAGGFRLALAGLCVGLGTRIGGGCTSGHGVCGIARLSPRSLAATAAFMACGIATVFVVRHCLGANP